MRRVCPMCLQPSTISPVQEHLLKFWPDGFSEDRIPSRERPVVEDSLAAATTSIVPANGTPPRSEPILNANRAGRTSSIHTNRLRLFFRGLGFDDDERTVQEEEITEFCGRVLLSVLRQPDREHARAAWLDDRLFSFYRQWDPVQSPMPNAKAEGTNTKALLALPRSEAWKEDWDESISVDVATFGKLMMASAKMPYRKYDSALTAPALYQHLVEKQFGHCKLPDADRRLIAISNLSPPFILALTETCVLHQAPTLVDTIFKHLALQTSMGVKISHGNYTVYQLHFHMPFYTFRTQRSAPGVADEAVKESRRGRPDVSVIAASLGIQEAHMAFAICGVADRRWIAYSFRDTIDDGAKDEDADEAEDEDGDTDDLECNYDQLFADQIAGDREIIDANRPIWNPREYYLTIVSRKLRQITNEWAKVIRRFEKGTRKHMDGPPSVKTHPKISGNSNDPKTRFDQTQKELVMLGHLHETLAGMNETWAYFSRTEGDIGYLRDFRNVSKSSQAHCRCLLQEIGGKFDELRELQRDLHKLVRWYESVANVLQLRLTLESNDTAKNTDFIGEFMVAYVSPVALVAALFNIPAPFGGFRRNLATFAAATFVVGLIIQAFIRIRKGWLKPERIFQKARDTKETPQPHELRFGEFTESSRRRGPFRTGTDSTLVEPDTIAAAV